MKKKRIALLSATALFLGAASVAIVSSSAGLIGVPGEATSYSITLDGTQNKFSTIEGEGTGTITRGNGYDVNVALYAYYQYNDGNWGRLAKGGWIANTTAIVDITSITVTVVENTEVTDPDYKPSAYVRWGEESGSYTTSTAYDIPNGGTYTFTFNDEKPDYFLLSCNENTAAGFVLSSIVIEYTCGVSA